MAKTKRVTSVLLTLCLAVVMLAGFLVAAPVQVKAVITNVDNYSFPVSVAPGDIVTLSFRYTYDGVPFASTRLSLYQTDSSGSSSIGPIAEFSLMEIGVSAILSSNTSLTFTAPSTAGIYYYILRWGPLGQPAYGNSQVFTLYVGVTPPSAPAPAPSTDANTDEYYQRHYDFWINARAKLDALSNNGSVTVDTEGYDLDHIQHFVFDALVGTYRTLIINHQGETYVIRGAREDTATGTMRGIALGNNYAFTNLQEFIV